MPLVRRSQTREYPVSHRPVALPRPGPAEIIDRNSRCPRPVTRDRPSADDPFTDVGNDEQARPPLGCPSDLVRPQLADLGYLHGAIFQPRQRRCNERTFLLSQRQLRSRREPSRLDRPRDAEHFRFGAVRNHDSGNITAYDWRTASRHIRQRMRRGIRSRHVRDLRLVSRPTRREAHPDP